MDDPAYPRVLVVGPVASLGGIATVIRMHMTMRLWTLAHCRILSTYDERNVFAKAFAMMKAYAVAPFLIRQSDLVHIHLAAQHSMLRKLPIILATKLMRRPYVVHLHAASENSVFRLTPQWLVRLIFLLSYRVIVLSDSWAAVVRKYIPDTRVTVLHNPVAKPRTPRLRPAEETQVVSSQASWSAARGTLNSWKQLPKCSWSFPVYISASQATEKLNRRAHWHRVLA